VKLVPMTSSLLHTAGINGLLVSHMITYMPIGNIELRFHFTYMSQDSSLSMVWIVQGSITISELG
jgi:hypothetical protein